MSFYENVRVELGLRVENNERLKSKELKEERKKGRRERCGEWKKITEGQIGSLSILGERRAPPTLVLSPQLPVPGPGGFGQLTRPPGETHTDRYTQQRERQTQRGRHQIQQQQKTPNTERVTKKQDRRG